MLGHQVGRNFVYFATYGSMGQLLDDRPGLRLDAFGRLVWARDIRPHSKGQIAALAIWADDTEQEGDEE
jgi:hypothetical protein